MKHCNIIQVIRLEINDSPNLLTFNYNVPNQFYWQGKGFKYKRMFWAIQKRCFTEMKHLDILEDCCAKLYNEQSPELEERDLPEWPQILYRIRASIGVWLGY